MQTPLQAKILQHLNAKKREQGFTLIELLVVIIIIGILSAVALPTFLNQAGKARQAGAESIIGAINRGQQAYRVENPDVGFASDVTALELGYTAAPEPDGYGAISITANSQTSATADATSNNTDDQPSLCGTATTATTTIEEGGCS